MLKKIKDVWILGNGPLQPSTGQKKQGMRKVELIGAADDRGVHHVGGRLGAARGPAVIREMLGQMMLGIGHAINRIELIKGSDVAHSPSIGETHQSVRDRVSACLEEKIYPIVLGGGHDYGFPHLAGVSDCFGAKKIGVINVDPHLDVRDCTGDAITSGSPFFLALESGALLGKNFVEFGIQPHCNDKKYSDYATSKGVKVKMLSDIRKRGVAKEFETALKKMREKKLKIVVSFDLDAVQSAHSPGVSSPQSDGFTPAEFFEMVEISARFKEVVSVGFFEYAPDLDRDKLSGRLLATAIHRFLSNLP